jgi:hypothetical protein
MAPIIQSNLSDICSNLGACLDAARRVQCTQHNAIAREHDGVEISSTDQ